MKAKRFVRQFFLFLFKEILIMVLNGRKREKKEEYKHKSTLIDGYDG